MAGLEIQHTETSGVDNTTLQTHISRLSSYRDELKSVIRDGRYNSPESTLILPTDERLGEKIDEITNLFSVDQGGVSDVIVVGMGGSARGSRAVYGLLAEEATARLHTVDTISQSGISKLVENIKGNCSTIEQVVVCVVSKSGRTVETISNANLLLSKLAEAFEVEQISQRVVSITQPGSELHKVSRDNGIKTLELPEQVPGRFGVFSAAGLLPLALVGIDTEAIQSGAAGVREVSLFGRPAADPAAVLASIVYTQIQANTRIINHFFFTPQARSLGRWSEQLFAESLGKRTNQRGEPVFSGLYPVTSIGPDDLHASLQLQLGGPKNFFTFFLREREVDGDLTTPISDSGLLPENLSSLERKTLGDVHQALTASAIESFREDSRPFVDISVPKFNAERIGQLLFLQQLIVMYVGKLLEINVFSQPQIDRYKDQLTAVLKK